MFSGCFPIVSPFHPQSFQSLTLFIMNSQEGLVNRKIQHFDHLNDVSCSSISLGAPELVRNMTPEYRLVVESRLKRKIDLRILPMIILMYIMNYLDRNNIAAARLAGLEDELHLTSVQFNVRTPFQY